MTYFTARDGTSIYYKELGSGRPVILIHGWPLSSDSWDPVMISLAEAGMRAIAYDRRGFGRSDHAPRGYDYDTFADDLADLISELGLEKDIGLAGFSMGGGEVARYLSRHEGRGVSAVALISSIVPFMLQTPDNPNGVPQAVFDQMTAGMQEDYRRFFTSFFSDFYGDGWITRTVPQEEKDWAWMTTMQAAKWAVLGAAKAFATTDFRPDLPRFRVPTLVIHGTADKTVPIDATARVVAATVPGARLVEYDGSAHGVFAADTQRLASDLTAFFQAN
jgi:non-heme chloroperoxidase